ncbi:MAG: hypothetical protein ABFD98_16725 [Syntrophobacteraceae bacterium]
MKCRGCGKELVEGDDYRMVAEWPFCPSCFEDLMKGPAKPRETPAAPVVQEQAPAPERCSACKRELAPGEGGKFGIWTFCPECYGDLVSLTRDETAGDEETAENEDGLSGAEAREDAEKDAVAARVAVGLATYVNCKGCGRRIPVGGSRNVDGELYCPDCYYALTEKEAQNPEARPAGIPGEAPGKHRPAEGEDRCACCDRPLRAGFHDTVEGFPLCGACLSTDSALALQIARERHRRLLDRLRSGLNPTEPN